MESDAFFHIPMNSRSDSFGSSTTAVVDAVEITSAPKVEIKTNNESKMADTLSLYDELSAISEEVIACRNAALNKA